MAAVYDHRNGAHFYFAVVAADLARGVGVCFSTWLVVVI